MRWSRSVIVALLLASALGGLDRALAQSGGIQGVPPRPQGGSASMIKHRIPAGNQTNPPPGSVGGGG